MKKSPQTVWKELKTKYKDEILLTTSPDHPERCTQEKFLWIHTSPGCGGRKKWVKVGRWPKNTSVRLCVTKGCTNKECKMAHSIMEKYIWELLSKNNLYLDSFIYTAERLDDRNSVGFNQFFSKWKGRFLLVCKQCYSLKPRIVKEMHISDGRDPKVYCRWCVKQEYLLLHELTFKNEKNVTFYEYNTVRQKPNDAVLHKGICRYSPDCIKGDGCLRAHSTLEFDFWKINAFNIFFDIVRYCNSRASPGRDTLNGMFHCDHCCLSFLQTQEYQKYMKMPHEHFEEICRSATRWLYEPPPEQTLERPFALCQNSTTQYCPGKGVCEKAHSEKEKIEWTERKKIANGRSQFSLQADAIWFDLKEIPQDIKKESRVKVTVDNLRRDIDVSRRSVKWTLLIETNDKEFQLIKVGFHINSGFDVRKIDEQPYGSLIRLNEDSKQKHKFRVLFINPKNRTYGTRTGNLICEFTGCKQYIIQFQVNIKGENIEIQDMHPFRSVENWANERIIVRYDDSGARANSYDETLERLVSRYYWKPPANETDMRDLSPQNYAEKMHDLLYAEEESRRAILSRLNIESTIEYGEAQPNGNMLGKFFIPISISTDEALLFQSSCSMLLIGEENGEYAYQCQIKNFVMDGQTDSQDRAQVLIDVPATCCKDLKLRPKSIFMHKIQFQLNRRLFCLRHCAIDNVGDKIALLCLSEDSLASPPALFEKRMCRQLDGIQDIVYQFATCPMGSKDDVKFLAPLVVAGPFGTGKTHTVKQIIENLLRNDDTSSILVCTHTNSAAGLYLEDHNLTNLCPEKILRVIYHGLDIKSVPQTSRRFCRFDKKGNLRYPSLPEVRQCRLIVTTFTTAIALFLETGVTSGLFSHIFLDESSQAMEADAIMPLLMADSKKTRIVLAGDHRQTTEKMYSDNKCQVKTLLERLYETRDNGKMLQPVLLRNNYRCVKGILDLISKLFYKKNALICASKAECIQGMQGVYFTHIEGECIDTSNGEYVNKSEADQIQFQVNKLVNEWKVLKQDDIVIVSSFQSQIKYIRILLRRNNLHDVSVMTVHNIQGQEFKAVILTTVMRRINCLKTPGKNFGFLSDFRIFNVALSRAKSLVMVVGDAVTLCSVGNCKKEWKAYLKHCEMINTILPKSVNVNIIRTQIAFAEKELRAGAKEFIPGTGAKEFIPEAQISQEHGEANDEVTDEESIAIQSECDDTSSYEDDDTDSWCSEASIDDIILDDMAKGKAIELSKVTIGLGEDHREFIQYESDGDDVIVDDDPNEVSYWPSRRQRQRTAIYPKFSIEHLEQKLEEDKANCKRCKINVKNWFSAEAIPISEDNEESLSARPVHETESSECNGRKSDDDENYSGEERWEMTGESTLSEAPSVFPTCVSNIIYIETRLNLGRTFDQDEALVKIIGTRRDPSNPFNIKRIGKVLGILRKRHIHPRNRHFLCRPNELSPALMNPYDRKLTLFAILGPSDRKTEFGKVPIHKFGRKERKNGIPELKFLRFEKVNESRVYVVRYLKWSECCMYPLGFVESSFEISDAKKYLSLEYRVSPVHKKEVIDELKSMKLPDFDNMPSIDVFTIDPEGSQDLDDAISFSKCNDPHHENCYEIGIHITDVASIVEEGSVIDKDAQKRLATFYGPEKPIHMLPEQLSTEMCSLLPDVVRQAISTTFHSCNPPYSRDYEPVQPQRTYIRSRRQLSYKEAEKLYKAVELEQMKELNSDDEHLAHDIHKLWSIMWEWRLVRLEGEAFYKRADTFEHILDSQAHLLIEEAMIATNSNTALYLTNLEYEIPMRAQDMPLEEDWTRWEKIHSNLIPNSCYLKAIRKHLRKRQQIHDGAPEGDQSSDSSENEDEGAWVNVQRRKRKVLKWRTDQPNAPTSSIQGKDSITIFKNYWTVMVKAKREGHLEGFTFVAACDDLHPSQIASVNAFIGTLKRAYFTTQNPFHFSLRLPQYAWSTSPIRRYSDILIQRCIHKSLEHEPVSLNTEQSIEQFCHVSDNRHKEFEDKLTQAVLARSFTNEPVAFEACIEQVTDAFVTISIPLAKYIKKQKLQIPFGNLMVSMTEQQYQNPLEEAAGSIIIYMTLGWRLRYYKHSDEHTHEDEPVSLVKLPVKLWKDFVQVLSLRPGLNSEHDVEEYKSDLWNAIKSLEDAAQVEDGEIKDIQICETPNDPLPITHKREISWKVELGKSVLVQLSGSLDTSRLPTPDIQLFSIANDLDVCVEHMKEPVKVFAKDALQPFNAEIGTLTQYRRKWEPLVRMDAANSAVKENSSITIQGVKIMWTPHRVSTADSSFELDVDNANFLKLKKGFCHDRYIVLHQGDLLCLRLKGVCSTKRHQDRQHQKLSPHGIRPHYTLVVHALVTGNDAADEDKNEVDLVNFKVLSTQVPVDAQSEDNLWTVEVIPLSVTHRYMQRALYTIASPQFKYDLLRSICLGIIQPTPISWNKTIKKRWLNMPLSSLGYFSHELNVEQRIQEKKAVTYNFSLIQGPPGTGKSLLGAQIAAKFAFMNRDDGAKHKVLYVGPSNKSVDVAAGYLKEIKGLKVVRMYSKALEEKIYPNPLKPGQSSQRNEDDSKLPDDQLKKISLHELIRNGNEYSAVIKGYDVLMKSKGPFKRKQMDYYSAIVNLAKLQVLQSADIVICTCSCSCQLTGMDSGQEKGLTFAQCIIDECAMCSEPETILPLFAVQPEQVVLIGDHMQLRPVITCTKAERLGLNESLFMRYKDQAGMLTTQYRMHQDIMKFPSDRFYDGRLNYDKSVIETTALVTDPFKPLKRAIFWNVKGGEGVRHFKTRDEGDQSKFNNAQAGAVVRLLLRLHSRNIPMKDIMILSPYTAQCARIREMLQQYPSLAQAKVGTVVTSQGSEANFVILSTVRALPSSSIMPHPNLQWLRKHLGFLTDPNQINVALTRAKKRLFVIGDKELLSVDSLWGDLLTVYQRNGAVINDLLKH